MTQIIRLSGVHGAGKTSIIEEYVKRLQKIDAEMNRTSSNIFVLPSQSFRLNDVTLSDKKTDHMFMQGNIKRGLEMNMLKSDHYSTLILSDRSVVDAVIYRAYNEGKFDDEFTRKLAYEMVSQETLNGTLDKVMNFLILRSEPDIKIGLEKRANTPERKASLEIDLKHASKIQHCFLEVWNIIRYSYPKNISDHFPLLYNLHSIKESVDDLVNISKNTLKYGWRKE